MARSDDKVTHVFAGWLRLSAEERTELAELVRRFERADWNDKTKIRKRLEEEVRKIHLGPVSEACPCCGR